MPKESFFTQADIDSHAAKEITDKELFDRGLYVSWGADDKFVKVGTVEMGWGGINRLIKALRKARDQRYGAPE